MVSVVTIKSACSPHRRLLDPPHHALGYPAPENAYSPLLDSEITAEERQLKFAAWITSYFVHSPSARNPVTPLRNLTRGILEQRNGNPAKKPTSTNFTVADVAAAAEVVSPSHGDVYSFGEHARLVHETVRIRALFGDLNETSGPPVLPKVGISYIWCTESIWETVLAMRYVQKDIESPPNYHYPARSVRFIALEGGNHFVRDQSC